MINTCLGHIFWGLLIVLLDINIRQFDILPDFIGYMFVASGTGGLSEVSSLFKNARILCSLLVAGSLISFFSIFVFPSLNWVLGLPLTIIQCYMMWSLLEGISLLAYSLNRPDLAVKAMSYRIIYVVLTCVATLFVFITNFSKGIANLGGIIVVISMLVNITMILYLIWQVKSAVRSTD